MVRSSALTDGIIAYISTKKEKKPPHEKPVSLFPLDFKEALAHYSKLSQSQKKNWIRQSKSRRKRRSPAIRRGFMPRR